MADGDDFNTQVIKEFRVNAGRVGGFFEGAHVLLLHTTGAKSGLERISPVMYQQVGDSLAVFASMGGAPTNPAWYHNLVANPKVTAEVGTETGPYTARVAAGDERERIWAQQKIDRPQFADYETQTTRQIPVIILEPAR